MEEKKKTQIVGKLKNKGIYDFVAHGSHCIFFF